MSTLKLDSPWEEVKERLKEVDPQLSDEDLQYDESDADSLIERLAKKKGKDAEFIKGWIESVSSNKGKAS